MKIVSRSPERLVFANKPWLLGLSMIVLILVFVGIGMALAVQGEVFPGSMFALIGGGMGAIAFIAFVRRTELILDVPSDSVTLRTRTVLGFSEARYRLSDVEAAYLEASQSSDARGMLRPVLAMKPGVAPSDVPVFQVYTNTSGPKRAADAINDWPSGRGAR